jgi:hypothetical protein
LAFSIVDRAICPQLGGTAPGRVQRAAALAAVRTAALQTRGAFANLSFRLKAEATSWQPEVDDFRSAGAVSTAPRLHVYFDGSRR